VVETLIGAHEPLAAILDALNNRQFDEVILTSHASRLSRWAHVDLRRKVADLDRQIRVLSLTARRERAGRDKPDLGPEVWRTSTVQRSKREKSFAVAPVCRLLQVEETAPRPTSRGPY
jgi:hypothetical protein